ncbi:MAG: hypothetical protein U9R66_05795 [Thermodesulfobacteriota bacterium]|nr:hypothetical protein [Thermodesulfobacteriota bacterium]
MNTDIRSEAEGQFEDLMGGSVEMPETAVEDFMVGDVQEATSPEEDLMIDDVEKIEIIPASDEQKVSETIQALKTAVLAFEWEINDENMERFNFEVSHLKGIWRDDKLLQIFIQILEALGKYITGARVKAHPDSVKLLLSVYEALEKVVTSPRLTPRGKKKILYAEVEKYDDLKAEITSRPERVQKTGTEEQAAESAPAGASSMMASHGGVGGDELIVERGDHEEFPELDARLDSFFDEESLPDSGHHGDISSSEVPAHPETESCPAVDNLIDDMFSDVIHKGKKDSDVSPEQGSAGEEDTFLVGEDVDDTVETVTSLDVDQEVILGVAEEEEGPSVIGDVDSLSLDLGEEDQEIVLETAEEQSEESVEGMIDDFFGEEDQVTSPPLQSEVPDTLPASLEEVFTDLAEAEQVDDDLAERLCSEVAELLKVLHGQPSLVTIAALLASLSGDLKKGSLPFRTKATGILLEIHKSLIVTVDADDTEVPQLVSNAVKKYLLWKEEMFSVLSLGAENSEAQPDKIESAQSDNETSVEEEEGILLLEPEAEVKEEDEDVSGMVMAEEVPEQLCDVSGEEQVASEADSFPKEGIWSKIKGIFSKK